MRAGWTSFHPRPFWLMILGALLILSFGQGLSRWLGLYGSVLLVCGVCAAVFWLIRSPELPVDFADMLLLFVTYYFLMFGLYGFMTAFGLSHYFGVSYNPNSDSPENISSLVSIYAAAFLLSVYAGYSLVGRNRLVLQRLRPALSMSVNLKKLPLMQVSAVLALGLSYLGCALMVFFLGGTSVIGLDPSYVSTDGTHGLYWAQALIWMNHWAVIINLVSYITSRSQKFLFLAALSIPVLFLEFLLSGSKSCFLLPFMGYVIARHYCFHRINWRTIAVLGVLVLLVFAAGYSYRAAGAQASQFKEGVSSYYQNPVVLLNTVVGRFYGSDGFAVVLDTVHNGQPLLMGRSLTNLLTWYIPRWLWSEKPVSYALTFGEEFMPNAPGAGSVYYSPSLPGELYLNFGLLGLPLGGLAIGAFLRFLHRALIETVPRKIESIVLYAVLAPLAAQFCEGPISTDIEFILTRVIPYFFLLAIAQLFFTPVVQVERA